MNILYYAEIFVQVCNYVDINKLIKCLEILCSYHKQIIRMNYWMNFEIKIQDINRIDHIVENYNFKKFNFTSAKNITDEIVKKFAKCHTLCFRRTNITDKGVLYL